MNHDEIEGTENVKTTEAGSVQRYYMDPWHEVAPYQPNDTSPRSRSAYIRDRYSASARKGSIVHYLTTKSFGAGVDADRARAAGLRCEAWLRGVGEFAQLCRDVLRGQFDLSAEPVTTVSFFGHKNRHTSSSLAWAIDPVGGIVADTYEIAGACGKCGACADAAAAAEASPASWVYFIQATTGGPVKIGYSASPYARLASLRSGSASDLRVAALTPGGVEEERMFHRLFARHRIRPRGEWFNPAPAILALIAELAEVSPP